MGMLCDAIEVALSRGADERHAYQTKVISMADQAFKDIETKLQGSVHAAHEHAASVDERRLQDAVMQQARVLARVKSTAADAEANEIEAKMKFTKADLKYKASVKDSTTAELEYASALKAKKTLDDHLVSIETMKTKEYTKRHATAAVNALQAFGVDSSLLATLRGVLSKTVEERGEFDGLSGELPSGSMVDWTTNELNPKFWVTLLTV